MRRAPGHGRWSCPAACPSFQTHLKASQCLWPCPDPSRTFWDSLDAFRACHAPKDTVGRIGCATGAPDEPMWGAHLGHLRGARISLAIGARLGRVHHAHDWHSRGTQAGLLPGTRLGCAWDMHIKHPHAGWRARLPPLADSLPCCTPVAGCSATPQCAGAHGHPSRHSMGCPMHAHGAPRRKPHMRAEQMRVACVLRTTKACIYRQAYARAPRVPKVCAPRQLIRHTPRTAFAPDNVLSTWHAPDASREPWNVLEGSR